LQKRRFISNLLAERDRFEYLLNQVGFLRRMTTPLVSGEWSVKDIIAHILANEQNIADRLHETIHGEVHQPVQTSAEFEAFRVRFGYPDFSSPLQDEDSSNEWVIDKYRGIPLEEVVAQEVNAFNAIMSALEILSDETLASVNLLPRVNEVTLQHYQHHRVEIEEWLNSQQNASAQG
jgi:hypothetical protein